MLNAIRKFFAGPIGPRGQRGPKGDIGKCECSGELAAIRTAVKNMEIKLNLWEISILNKVERKDK